MLAQDIQRRGREESQELKKEERKKEGRSEKK